jgi:hypothetical protein
MMTFYLREKGLPVVGFVYLPLGSDKWAHFSKEQKLFQPFMPNNAPEAVLSAEITAWRSQ